MSIKYDPKTDGIFYNDHAYMIGGYIDETDPSEFINNRGYVDKKGKVWVYKDETYRGSIPWFTIKYGLISFHKAISKKAEEYFVIENIGSFSIDSIANNIDPEQALYDENVLEDMNAATSKYKPTIDETDDFLKKIVKYVILEKGVDVNRYKSAVSQKYTFSNLLSALKKKTKMSTTNFNTWMELLGVDVEITIKDDGRRKSDPLEKTIVYNSRGEKIEIK